MITKFELSPYQVNKIIKWKELHMKECQGIMHKFHISFSDETSYCVNLKCLECNKGCNVDDFDEYDKSNKNKYLTDRQFTEYIFLGAGSFSTLNIDKLHARLAYAVAMLGGQQQNGGMGSEYSVEEEKETEKAIIEVIQDIAVALGVEDKIKIDGK